MDEKSNVFDGVVHWVDTSHSDINIHNLQSH